MLIAAFMTIFAITLLLTFVVVVAAMLWLSYCKRHQRHGKHGLTGMCHESGGTVCSTCAGLADARSQRSCRDKGGEEKTSSAAFAREIGNGGQRRGQGKGRNVLRENCRKKPENRF
jgi:hypothetical protein